MNCICFADIGKNRRELRGALSKCIVQKVPARRYANHSIAMDVGHDGHGVLVISLEERPERVATVHVAFLVIVPLSIPIHFRSIF